MMLPPGVDPGGTGKKDGSVATESISSAREAELHEALAKEVARYQNSMRRALEEHFARQELLMASCSPPPPAIFQSPSPKVCAVSDSAAFETQARMQKGLPELASERSRVERRISKSTTKQKLHEVHVHHGSIVHAFLFRYCENLLVWWWSLEEPPRTSRVAKFISSSLFYAVVTSVIIANSVHSAIVTNYELSGALVPESVRVLDGAFVIFYVGELVLKLIVHRLYFFAGEEAGWNTFDFILAVISVTEFLLELIYSTSKSYQVLFVRTMRLLRISRALRGFKAVRVFHELRVILNCVVGSLSSMVWSIVMLLFLIYLFSLVLLQFLSSDIVGDPESSLQADDVKALREIFGSVQGTMLSLYIMAMGGTDWAPTLTLIPDDFVKMLFVLFLFFFQITMLNILTGIYVDTAMKYAAPDHKEQAQAVMTQQIEDSADLVRFLREQGVTDDEPDVFRDSFLRTFEESGVCAYLATYGIIHSEPKELYQCLIEDGYPETVLGFVEGLLKMREPATHYDIERMRTGMAMRSGSSGGVSSVPVGGAGALGEGFGGGGFPEIDLILAGMPAEREEGRSL